MVPLASDLNFITCEHDTHCQDLVSKEDMSWPGVPRKSAALPLPHYRKASYLKSPAVLSQLSEGREVESVMNVPRASVAE